MSASGNVIGPAALVPQGSRVQCARWEREYRPPRVTVLIGCWNNAPTLRAAIDSILEQTLSDLELIVVDDGSTDATSDIVRDMQVGGAAPAIHAARAYGDLAQPQPRPAAAGGEFVAFQDADDWSLPQRLERELKAIEARAEVAVVGCRMREVDPAGRDLAPRTAFAAGDVNEVLLRFNPIPNSSAMVRRNAALAVGGFDPRYRYAMDYDLWLRLAERNVITTLDELLAVRLMGATNVAARKERAQTRRPSGPVGGRCVVAGASEAHPGSRCRCYHWRPRWRSSGPRPRGSAGRHRDECFIHLGGASTI